MKLRPITSAVLLALSLAAASHAYAADAEVRRSYIIQLADKPVATYTGEVAGLPATRPSAGQRLNVDAAAVQNYIGYLDNKKAAVLASVNQAQVTHEYQVVFNGFSAMLTDAEVRALKKNPGVANISADSMLQLDTNYTPSFLGLDRPGGLWEQVGGQDSAGEDIIIGIVDGGIWPEHDSFADRVDENGNPSRDGSRLAYGAPPSSWKGECQTGEGFQASDCNNKLIGARYFKVPTQNLHWTEFLSPRDSVAGAEGKGGHGDHTASTAGGNARVAASVNGQNLGRLSGMAPRARIAAYKVCWTDATTAANSCATSNSVAAIEAAVRDGVNVINFSIGSSSGGGAFNDATEVAFLGATAAGVFVSTSAGNQGPTSSAPAPVGHISPWLATVGNSTHNRLYAGDAVLGNGMTLTGASSNANTPASPLILAKDAGKDGIDPANASLNQCLGAADGVAALLDPVKVAGKILVCDRGNNNLVNKSANARTAGASGAIIANVADNANTITNQTHTLSTVHLLKVDADKLKAYIAATPSASAALGNLHGIADPSVIAPIMSGSSSRGPNVANANIMKPDLTAPGSNILAAVTAGLTRDQRNAVAAGEPAQVKNFAYYSGTSMASPHVAGVAALLKQRHPDWTPAMIKSAMMTTAYDTFSDNRSGTMPWDTSGALNSGMLPWGQGAGHLSPTSAADPGLVYNATETDYIRFLCGLNVNVYSAATCAANGTIQPYDLNLASLTAANVLGVITLNRTVTNVGASQATYNATTTLPGYTVAVTPSTLTLAPGASGRFTVKLTRTTAAINNWVYGKLTWSDGVHTVRSPLIARASLLAAPATVNSEATAGTKVITVGTGFAGALTVAKSGLVPATEFNSSVVKAPNTANSVCVAGGGTGVNVHTVTIPAGTSIARFSLFDSDTSGDGQTDLDMVVVRGTTVVGTSGNGTSNEQVQLSNPVAGDYKVCVVGYDPIGGSATYKLSTWVLSPNASGGNFKAMAAGMATVAGTAPVALSWSGLAVGKRHLGSVTFMNGANALGTTVVEVDTTDPLPLFKDAVLKQVNAQ